MPDERAARYRAAAWINPVAVNLDSVSIDLALLLACAAGIGVILAVIGLDQVARGRVQMDSRLEVWRWRDDLSTGPPAILSIAEPGTRLSRVPGGGTSHIDHLRRELARADIRLRPSEFLTIQAGLIGIGLLVGLVSGNLGASLALMAFGILGPRQFLRMAQKRRIDAFANQLASTLMMVSASLRAGYSLLQSMETVARESIEPTRSEFGRVIREVGLGMNVEDALNNLYRRLPGGDLDLMVTAVHVQHEVGGNLARILDTLSETLRERTRVYGEIQTLTAQQRLGGMIIALLPVGLAAALFILRPAYLRPLLTSDPIIGIPAFALLILAAVMVVAGYVTIRRLVAIDV